MNIVIPMWVSIGTLITLGCVLVSVAVAFTKLSESNKKSTEATINNTSEIKKLNDTLIENNIYTKATKKLAESNEKRIMKLEIKVG